MCLRTRRYVTALISLLVLLLAGQASVQGYVLCVAENGHLALEYAQNNDCSAKPEQERHCPATERTPNTASTDDHCGPCLDIPASRDLTSFRQQLDKYLSPPAGLAVVNDRLIAGVSTPPRSITPPDQIAPRISPAILAHRTIVLLN